MDKRITRERKSYGWKVNQDLRNITWDALRDLLSFVQFKKREKRPFTKSNTSQWVFFTFFGFCNITKLRETSLMNPKEIKSTIVNAGINFAFKVFVLEIWDSRKIVV